MNPNEYYSKEYDRYYTYEEYCRMCDNAVSASWERTLADIRALPEAKEK